LPGVLEAMDRRDWKEAESQIPRAAKALVNEAAIIDSITAQLAKVQKKLGYKYFVDGNPADVVAQTRPGVALMGGGTDQDAAFQWMCQKAGSGDFVVLRASGTDAYNPYIKNLCPALDSVETLVITSRDGASQPFVADKIRKAEALFIAGGSQDNYFNFWKDTPVQEAIQSVIAKGAPVGGTSAGLAVLGQYAFVSLKDTIKTSEALPNPYDERVTLARDFLRVPNLEGKITDSHFVARDRMGRLLAFLGRISKDGWTASPSAIGIDEKTVLLMEADGTATAVGKGAVYFLHAPGPPEECSPNKPLTYRNIATYKLTPGSGIWNLKTWTGTGGTAYSLSATGGRVTSTQAGGEIY
jgi:cyanophycinase